MISILLTHIVLAHQAGMSVGTYTPSRAGLSASIVFARGEADPRLMDGLSVTRGGQPCTSAPLESEPTEADGMRFTARFTCPSPGDLAIDAGFIDRLAAGHRHVANGGYVLFRGHVHFDLAAPTNPGFLALFVMGVEHILTGFDHLAFLLALVVVRGRLRNIVSMVTAFTVAHSLSLALATLGIATPPSRIIEPLIAASIVYIAVATIIRERADQRWMLALGFGFIHGFGFASALRELGLTRADLPPALLAFNLGVEAGQLAVLALVLPLLMLARRLRWYDRYGVRAVSACVAIAGTVWLVQRL